MSSNTNRVDLYINPETGDPDEVFVGDDATYGFEIVDRDGNLKDLTSETLTVEAKAAATGDALTYTFVADANQTTTGKGKATLTMPAAQHTLARVGTINIDLKINGAARWAAKIELKDSDAD